MSRTTEQQTSVTPEEASKISAKPEADAEIFNFAELKGPVNMTVRCPTMQIVLNDAYFRWGVRVGAMEIHSRFPDSTVGVGETETHVRFPDSTERTVTDVTLTDGTLVIIRPSIPGADDFVMVRQVPPKPTKKQKRKAERDKAAALQAQKLAEKRRLQGFGVENGVLQLGKFTPTIYWHPHEPTAKQRLLLSNNEIDLDLVTCRGHASALIDIVIQRSAMKFCSLPQMIALSKLGHPDPLNATKVEAKEFLNLLIP